LFVQEFVDVRFDPEVILLDEFRAHTCNNGNGPVIPFFGSYPLMIVLYLTVKHLQADLRSGLSATMPTNSPEEREAILLAGMVAKHGIEISLEDAEIMLELLRKISKLSVNEAFMQLSNSQNEAPSPGESETLIYGLCK